MKKALRGDANLSAGCSKAESKIFAPLLPPFRGRGTALNLISWRWSLPLPTNPVWWGSVHAISSYRARQRSLMTAIYINLHFTLLNRPPHTPTHPQTDRTDYNTLRRS